MAKWQCPIKRKQWHLSPKERYAWHKGSARDRGIQFQLTFEEWWGIWEESGKYQQRGRYGDDYCMCRTNDEGPYAVGNVRIDTHRNNIKESHGTGGKARSMSKLSRERAGSQGK